MGLCAKPCHFAQAKEYIKQLHRHHKPPVSWKFGISAWLDDKLVGVITVGRPVARMLDDGVTAEVTRLCTDGTKNACSFLYSAAWRAAEAMGYTRLITYILESESGASLKATGWTLVGNAGGGRWSRKGRERLDEHPTCKKQLWEKRGRAVTQPK